MVISRISYISKLKELIASMERDLGLVRFSNDELNVIYALTVMSGESAGGVRSSDLKSHVLCDTISSPTFYRIPRRLLDRGAVIRSGELKTGTYKLSEPLV